MSEAFRLSKERLVVVQAYGISQSSDAVGQVVRQVVQHGDFLWAKSAWLSGVDHERPDRHVVDDQRQSARGAEPARVGCDLPRGEAPRPVHVLEHLNGAGADGRAGRAASKIVIAPTEVSTVQVLGASGRRYRPHRTCLIALGVADPCHQVPTRDDDGLTHVRQQGCLRGRTHKDLVTLA